MRELKFRAITTHANINKFVYGMPIKAVKKGLWLIQICEGEFGWLNTVGIDYNTLGQFTGLLDKNGKEIYEGDIVNYKTSPESGTAIISSWIGNNLYFEWINSIVPPTNADIFGCKEELEVIGNIHENPELLEVTK